MPSSRGTTAKSEAKRKKIVIEAKDAKGAAVLSLIEALKMFRFHRERHSHFPFFPLKWTPFSWKQVSILLFFFASSLHYKFSWGNLLFYCPLPLRYTLTLWQKLNLENNTEVTTLVGR